MKNNNYKELVGLVQSIVNVPLPPKSRTQADLNEITKSFEVHCMNCEDCSVFVKVSNIHCEIIFNTMEQPTLCETGKRILMDIFN